MPECIVVRMTLDDAFAGPGQKRAYARRLFGTIAPRYDLITRLLSYGQDRRWKQRLAGLAGAGPDDEVLDLACGTGDLAFESARRGARVTALDLAAPMIAQARARQQRDDPARRTRFLLGDMTSLPFPAGRFSLVTTGYGLRNVPDLHQAIDEIVRVLRPAGRLLSLDFNRPESWPMRSLYLGYLTVVGSALGIVLHGDPDTYRYIPASIRRYPGARGVAELLRSRAFDVRVVPLLGGLMALHVATLSGSGRVRAR